MSYILDALKKSEQERGRGSAPSVQTLHTIGHDSPTSKTHYWPQVLLFAVFVNLGALLYFIITDASVEQPAASPLTIGQTEPTTVDKMHALPAYIDSEPLSSVPLHEEIVYKQVEIPAVAQTTVRPTHQVLVETTPVYTPPEASLLQRDELPDYVQQQIPIMEFSAHVYSSNPLHRSIVINGRFMEEGDQFASDLTLSEITPKGAIFDYQGQLFHQNVVSAWN
ncbi:MAG: general secretion pathway protein GspB [Gammaproteobacteria bacterium]|nr:general secretion pathway protein GspB [Gammaproteobacteria bacterium]